MITKDCDINEVLNILETMHPEAGCALNYNNLFQLIIAVSLSAQTTDISVNNITPNLFEKYPTPEDLARADISDVENIIRTIGLYKNKSKNIVNLAKMLINNYDSKIPDNMDELVKLPGVGRKTANVVLSEGFGIPAIAVDTHVFRVANRIGISNETDVESTENTLMQIIPKDKWIRAHHLLIFHGRKVCYARKPNCEECLLNKLCKYYTNNLSQ